MRNYDSGTRKPAPPPPTTFPPLLFLSYFMGSGGGWVSSGRRARAPEQSDGWVRRKNTAGAIVRITPTPTHPKKSHIRRRSWPERPSQHNITSRKKKGTLHAGSGSGSGVQKNFCALPTPNRPSESGDFSCS
jgi:hypothetical protein